jgi:hypothetical protein
MRGRLPARFARVSRITDHASRITYHASESENEKLMETLWLLLCLGLMAVFGGSLVSYIIHDLRTRRVCPECERLVDRCALACPICGYDLSEPEQGV